MADQNRSSASNTTSPSWSSTWEQLDGPRDEQQDPTDDPIGKAHAATPGYEGKVPDEAEDTEDDEDADETEAADEDADEVKAGAEPNEGEGNRTAARRYAAGVKSTVQQGDVDEHASEAAEALDGPEGDELRRAEQQAKRGPGPTTPRH